MIIGSAIALSFFALLALFVPLESAATTNWLLATLGLLTCFPMVRWLKQRPVDFFELIYPVAFSYAVFFVLTTPGALNDPLLPYPSLTNALINRALLYTAMGFSFLMLGYYGTLPLLISRRLPRLNTSASPGQACRIIYILYLLGTAFRLYMIHAGMGTWSVKEEQIEYGSTIPVPLSNLVGYLGNFSVFAYVLATTYFFTQGRTRMLAFLLWGIMFPLECLWCFLQASKTSFIPILASPAIAYNYLKRRPKLRSIALPGLLFVFAVFPLTSAYRGFAKEYPLRLQTLPQVVPEIVKALGEEVMQPESESYVARGPEMAAERATGITLFASVIQHVESRGFIHGETLWQAPLLLVPTIFLPTKYEHLDYGATLYSEVIGGFSSDSRTGISLTHIGEFYLNFGLSGVFIGLFLQGVLFRVWQVYWTNLGKPLGIAIFILGWRMLTSIEYPISIAYGLLLRELLLMALISWLITRGRPPEALGGKR